GGSFRRYKLDSDGQLFNDGPFGFSDPILIEEQGAYLQAGKKLANKRIHLRGSLRYDKHQDFEARFTPRLSSVISLGKNKVHNIRASYQTGFRNPAAQEAYIALDIGRAIILGGVENNVETYNYATESGPQINGLDIHSGLVTAASFIAFQQGGAVNPTLLVPANLSFLEQEKNTTFEIGYNGLIDNKFFVDLNYYRTTYKNFVVRNTTVSPLVGEVFAVYTNIDQDISSDGFGLGLKYWLGTGYQAQVNYTYTRFDAEEAVQNNPEFLPGFNTPKNRFNVSLSNHSVSRTGFGFNLQFRYWDDYQWQSPFGQGEIPSKGIIDLAFSYKIKSLRSMLKLGANNLLQDKYRTVYGGPEVGAIYYASLTYDRIFGR
ncbi:MAG: TonB-dependent receptor domain-containing protein, partial [Aurantibacter sp.]